MYILNLFLFNGRRQWDSNPRAMFQAHKISSLGAYDQLAHTSKFYV